jgi:hypothetical protein
MAQFSIPDSGGGEDGNPTNSRFPIPNPHPKGTGVQASGRFPRGWELGIGRITDFPFRSDKNQELKIEPLVSFPELGLF